MKADEPQTIDTHSITMLDCALLNSQPLDQRKEAHTMNSTICITDEKTGDRGLVLPGLSAPPG